MTFTMNMSIATLNLRLCAMARSLEFTSREVPMGDPFLRQYTWTTLSYLANKAPDRRAVYMAAAGNGLCGAKTVQVPENTEGHRGRPNGNLEVPFSKLLLPPELTTGLLPQAPRPHSTSSSINVFHQRPTLCLILSSFLRFFARTRT